MNENQTESISLTMEPFKAEEPVVETVEEVKEEVLPAYTIDDSTFSDAEKKMVDDFAKQIDITNTGAVLQYGAAAQQKMAEFSDSALANVRTKNLDEIGDQVAGLVTELKSFDSESDAKGLFGLFKKNTQKIETLKAKYDKVDVNVSKIVDYLEDQQVVLYKDIATLDEMYNRNLTNFKELSMYILAGEKRLAEARNVTLQELAEKAKKSNLAEDAQKANDYAELCNRFERKLHDLKLTREVALQTGPQIRLIQSADTSMVEKIQSIIQNTIPLWKNQMVISLGIAHSQNAIRATREVNNMTNKLLQGNAEKLHMATVEAA